MTTYKKDELETGKVTADAAQEQQNGPGSNGFSYKPYAQSDAVKQAQQQLQTQLSQKPGAYQSQWQTQLNDAMDKILNREKFSYDLNGDALYQQYKDQYVTQGKMAMMDTMGQAQAMTGGYGNSYAQAAGQQAYQGHLQQLNDRIPELWQLAMNKYQMEGDRLYDQAALMAQMENQDYGRYRDQVGDWRTQLDYLSGRYDTERDYDYGMWADDRNFQYQQDRDKTADEQWKAEFDEAKRQYDQAYALENGGSSDNDSGDDDNTYPGPYYDNGGLTANQIQMVQYSLGVEPTGYWDEATAQAAGGMDAKAAYDAWNQGNLGSPVGLSAEAVGNMGKFTGTTYSEAVAYMKKNGVPDGQAAGILTKSEWNHAKAVNSPRDGANEFDSYAEYLESAVGACIDAYGKK